MSLTDVAIKQAKPAEREYWLTDAKGLRLLVKPNGSKYWRLKYRFDRKQKTLALGVYPEVSLKAVRVQVNIARAQLAEGKDPGLLRKQEKVTRDSVTPSFDSLAEKWWEHQKGTWTPEHADRIFKRLQNDVSPILGCIPIVEIKPADVIGVIKKIEARGSLDVAQRALQDIRRVCRYAVQHGYIEHNPASELSDVLKPRKTTHRASLPREELPLFLYSLANYADQGRLLTQLAVQLLVLTFVRPGELRGAKWEEFDLNDNLWRIPPERMKMDSEHIVPLSTQALNVLEQIKLITGEYKLLFVSERDRQKPMSDNTMRRAIFRLGFDGNTPNKSKCVPHGFRATASSILNETGFNPDAIERQLSHMERNGVRAAYTHHARYLEERQEMMQWWADYLDDLQGNERATSTNRRT